MRISELATETGVSIPTLKYYLREGLLHAGQTTSATRASYDTSHVKRVRLVRALVDGAGLSIASVRTVVAALESPPASPHELLGVAHRTLPTAGLDHPVSPEVRDLVASLGWDVTPDAPALRSLSAALDNARQAGILLPPEVLARYAEAVLGVAQIDVSAARTVDSVETALTVVVLGTLLVDPVLTSLRRLAQEHVSAQP